MAITVPAGLQIVTSGSLVAPALMASTPLKTALEDLNFLWMYHQPPLVDLAPSTMDRLSPVHHAIRPSADGLLYTLQLRILPSNNSTVDILIKTCDVYAGGATVWNHTIVNTTQATTAGTLLTYTTTATVSKDAVCMYVKLTPAAGSAVLEHILVYPSPATVPAGRKTGSGALPFEDGLLSGTAGAPVHAEFVNRCRTSSVAILADRWQQCLSFAAESPPDPSMLLTLSEDWVAAPKVRAYFRGQTEVDIRLFVIASVSGGSTSDRVRIVTKPGAQLATFDADGTIQQVDVTALPDADGRVYFELQACAEAPNTTYIHDVSGYWRPAA